MVSLTLTPLAPWQAAHTVATLAFPASTSAAWARGTAVSTRSIETTSVFMGTPFRRRMSGSQYARIAVGDNPRPRLGVPGWRCRVVSATLGDRSPGRAAALVHRLAKETSMSIAGGPVRVTFAGSGDSFGS